MTRIPATRATMVAINWPLLNESLRTSKLPLGATRVKNKSRPDAKMRLVDSSSAGLVFKLVIPNNYD
jgi:hypothetical protein